MECEHCNGKISLGDGIYFRSEMYHRKCLDEKNPMWRYPPIEKKLKKMVEAYQEI